jgi:hypothetical protein
VTVAVGAPEDDHVEGTLSADGREDNKRGGGYAISPILSILEDE